MLLSHSSKEKKIFYCCEYRKKTFVFQRVEVQWYKMKSIPMWIGVFSQDTDKFFQVQPAQERLHRETNYALFLNFNN